MVDLVFDIAFPAATILCFAAFALFVRGCERM